MLEEIENGLAEGAYDLKDIEFEDLFDIADIQKLQDEFAAGTGVASIITRPDGTPITRPSNFCRLCNDIIRKTEIGCRNCQRSDKHIGKLCIDGPTVRECESGGLWDAGAGITAGGKHIANWLVGQISDNTQTTERIREYACEIGADAEEVVAAFEEVTYMSLEQFKSIAEVLFTFSNLMSQLAYQNLQKNYYIVERKRAEAALRQNEELLRNVFNATNEAIFLHELDGTILDVNDSMLRMYNLSKDEVLRCSLLGELSADCMTEDDLTKVLTAANAGKNDEFEWIAKRLKDGSTFPVLVSLKKFYHNERYLLLAVVRDISELKEAEQIRQRLEAQLQHSQKMDAIGQLAGGIAHDFNNMLGGIMGAADMLERYLPACEDAHQMHHIILEAAENAAALTRKLLVFARQQSPASTPISVHKVIQETVDILQRTLDKSVNIEQKLLAASDIIIGDSTQLQSMLINLAINSAHAMPDGGELLLATSNMVLTETVSGNYRSELAVGEYIEIEVRDTGCGMAEDILPRIFEPFFTTKGVGKGTGLGLAAVYGTIRQHSGAISVYSIVGEGTYFHILLPIDKTVEQPKPVSQEKISGQGHILVVDDEPIMRITAEAILGDLGYTVTTAENGAAALEIFRKSPEEFDLVVLDMIMPVMNGKECFYQLKQILPEVKVIISSGFTREEDIGKLQEQGLAGFIRKPFHSAALSQLLGKLLQG